MRAVKEQPSDFGDPFDAALTLSVHHEVASESLSWRPLTRSERHMRKVLPAKKGELHLQTASRRRKVGDHIEVTKKTPAFKAGTDARQTEVRLPEKLEPPA